LPTRMDELVALGMSAQSLKALMPYVTILPTRTKININTATPLVLASIFPDMSLEEAQMIKPQNTANPPPPYEKPSDFLESTNPFSQSLLAQMSVSSDFFEIEGSLRFDDLTVRVQSLVQRQDLKVQTVWRRRAQTGNLP